MKTYARIIAGAMATTLAGATLVAGAAPAGADESAAGAATALDYTCTFPLVGPRPVAVEITTNLPAQLEAGEETPTVEVHTVATVDSFAADGLRTVGAATVSGTAEAAAALHQPSGATLQLEVPAEIAETALPESGPFSTDATASLFPIVFDQPGTATVTVDDLVLTITPRDDDGRKTGLDTFHADCALAPGQENTVAVIEVAAGDPDDTPEDPEDPVEEPNNPPVAHNVWRIVERGQPTVIELPVVDPDGDELTITVTEPTTGTVEIDGTTVTFHPAKPGKTAFTYTADDGRGGQATGKVDLIVKGDGVAWWAWLIFGWLFEQAGLKPFLTW